MGLAIAATAACSSSASSWHPVAVRFGDRPVRAVARPAAIRVGRPGPASTTSRTIPTPTIPGLVVFRTTPRLFREANDFKRRSRPSTQAVRVEWLLLNAEAIVEIDLTSADALGELNDELERRGILLALARVKQDLRVQLERIGLVTHIGPDRLFATLPVALEAFERRGEESA